MIPQTFEEWYNCIVIQCKIKIDRDFIQKRLAVYHNPDNPETKRFIQLYGHHHFNNIINWYNKYEQQL